MLQAEMHRQYHRFIIFPILSVIVATGSEDSCSPDLLLAPSFPSPGLPLGFVTSLLQGLVSTEKGATVY